MTKEKFLYGLNACAVTYHNGQKFYEHDELVKCFEELEIFEQEPQETWNGYHGQITAPKGTFEKIYNDTEEETQEEGGEE